MNPIIIWLILLVVLVIVELITVGLTTIWFAGGALVAMIAAVFGAPLYIQIILFLVVSAALLIFTRPLAMKYMNKSRTKTNVDSLMGKRAVVTAAIDNLKGTGQVVVNGLEWTARSKNENQRFQKDEIVNIVAVNGVKLIVTPTGEKED
ncbi:MAG: NfeD family protein [Lachnospiraceae bacterium]|nr:NfeD family protein [Lachnospiraceae bacterium]